MHCHIFCLLVDEIVEVVVVCGLIDVYAGWGEVVFVG